MDKRDIKALWREHGGRQHGPRVETMTIPEADFWKFITALHDEFQSSLPDHIDVYRTIKRSKARKHGDIAKAVAASLS